MAKGGKVQHWKHGWIPLTAWARAQVAKHGGNPDLPSQAEKDDARRARYNAHLNATADKRQATEDRYNAAQARKAGVGNRTAEQMKTGYENDGFDPPQSKIHDRVTDGEPFVYSPVNGKVTHDRPTPFSVMADQRAIPLRQPTGDRRLDLDISKANHRAIDAAIADLIDGHATDFQRGAKIGGTKAANGGYLIGVTR